MCYKNSLCHTSSTKCQVHFNNRHEVAMHKFKYEVDCACSEFSMGANCGKNRNACLENYNKNQPSGNDACTHNGKCTPEIKTNFYECNCNPSWYDDPSNDFPDCYLNIDKCNEIVCINGYCKASTDNKNAICVCDEGFIGETCSRKLPQWLEWEAWSECLPRCGFDRVRNRTRACPTYSSEDLDKTYGSCYLNGNLGATDFQLCEFVPCPSQNEGFWGEWGAWSECSKRCDDGFEVRRRDCFYKGVDEYEVFRLPCLGLDKEFRHCNLGQCTSLVFDLVLIGLLVVLLVKFFALVWSYRKEFLRMSERYEAECERKRKSGVLSPNRTSYLAKKNKLINLEQYSIKSIYRSSVKLNASKLVKAMGGGGKEKEKEKKEKEVKKDEVGSSGVGFGTNQGLMKDFKEYLNKKKPKASVLE